MTEFDPQNENPKMLSPLNLAFVGDAVYSILVREYLIAKGSAPVGKLHKKAVSLVCASAQSRAVDNIYPLLSEDEVAIFKRGRNANSTPPRNGDHAEYRQATGLEALFGYLYLAKKIERINELFMTILEKEYNL